jgi:hypothetical protein
LKTGQLHPIYPSTTGGFLMLTRRTFLASSAAAATIRAVPQVAKTQPARRILTLVYDKALGGLRAVDKLVR